MLWWGDTLILLHWNHKWLMTIITPHLSIWGNARTRATFPTHKKSHNPHPRGGEGEGGQDGYIATPSKTYPCSTMLWGGGYLKPTPLKPYITTWYWSSLHIYHYETMQGQGPHFLPTRKPTIHIHRRERGKGVKMGTLHWVGVGGGPAKPESYITQLCEDYFINHYKYYKDP